MRIIPSTISLKVKSNAEKKVFGLFSQMMFEDSSICFHSLRLSEHHYKKIGELDFVIISKAGLFVLEVKGGSICRDEEGIWTITDRNLVKHRKHESPFEQASSGLFSIIDRIKENFDDQLLSRMHIGYGVVFPDCVFDIDSVEWASEMIIDQRGFKSPSLFKNSFLRLVNYWKRKSSLNYELSSKDIGALISFLRPRFDMAESLGHRAGEIDRLMVTLTNQQLEKMDAIEANQRILCTGGAGTGKTFIALEVARRLSEQGRKVLFICKSEILSSYLKTQVDPIVHVRNFEEIDQSDIYDSIVVDEGQDAVNFDDLGLLDRILKGGLEKGIWRIFLDKNNQKGLYGRYEEAAMEMLILCNPVQINLTRNCRNTEPIVNAVRLLTANDIGTATAGDGPQVRYLYANDEQEAIAVLEKELAKLLEGDVSLGDISLLSVKNFKNSVAAKIDARYRKKITELDSHNAKQFPFSNISFATIHDFKGLENRFIFILDLSKELFDAADKSALYVAMTRARAGLGIILSNSLKTLVNSILIKNISLIQTTN